MAAAEDIAMEVYLALAMRPRLLCGRREPRLYVIGIARRKIADYLRKTGRQMPDELALNGHAPSTDAIAAAQILQRLEPDHAEVLVLRLMQGFTARETARLMRKTPAAIDSLLHRAKAAFRSEAGDAFTPTKEKTDETQRTR